ncbi:hypothetical protein [Mesorhizobium sp.]|uniref:hypothetical protein n=1 Tax=Mesorhizobium sp. TaxID=1871066 RepID=UPI00142EEBAC|nr:hypothetical protein [Mesorhizobium sp.]
MNAVNFHIKHVKKKLNAASRTIAAIKAVDLGIIEINSDVQKTLYLNQDLPVLTGSKIALLRESQAI